MDHTENVHVIRGHSWLELYGSGMIKDWLGSYYKGVVQSCSHMFYIWIFKYTSTKYHEIIVKTLWEVSPNYLLYLLHMVLSFLAYFWSQFLANLNFKA